jgi:hypothetical protein
MKRFRSGTSHALFLRWATAAAARASPGLTQANCRTIIDKVIDVNDWLLLTSDSVKRHLPLSTPLI